MDAKELIKNLLTDINELQNQLNIIKLSKGSNTAINIAVSKSKALRKKYMTSECQNLINTLLNDNLKVKNSIDK